MSDAPTSWEVFGVNYEAFLKELGVEDDERTTRLFRLWVQHLNERHPRDAHAHIQMIHKTKIQGQSFRYVQDEIHHWEPEALPPRRSAVLKTSAWRQDLEAYLSEARRSQGV